MNFEEFDRIEIFGNDGQLVESCSPKDFHFMMVQIFGNAERIDFFDTSRKRIAQIEAPDIDTSSYAGYYFVYKKGLEDWSKLSKVCSGGKKRKELLFNDRG